jgi:predicted small metal-binding protein
LTAGELAFVDDPAGMLEHHTAQEVDPQRRLRHAKILPNSRQGRTGTIGVISIQPGDATKECIMAKIINCDCGFVVRGDTDDELVANAIAHARDVHHVEITREYALDIAVPA